MRSFLATRLASARLTHRSSKSWRTAAFAVAALCCGVLPVAAPAAAQATAGARADGAGSAATSAPPVVGKMFTWVHHMPSHAYRGGRALKFTFATRQTSHDIVWVQFYIGMFTPGNTASAHSENRGVTLRWYDPVTKTWRKAMSVDPTGGWTLGPRAGFTIKHDQVLRIPVRIWFGRRAWLGVHQLEAIVDDYAIYTPSGKNINATLWTPTNPQYRFDVRS
ncbi:MAG: hypothetical protein ACLQFR_25575 [Streptosporangiaceae bacterium]